jgi:transposase-like protein
MPGQKVKCPKCGAIFPVKSPVGRKPLNIPVNKIYDALRDNPSIAAAANRLGCSRGYLYKVLKTEGERWNDIPINARIAIGK